MYILGWYIVIIDFLSFSRVEDWEDRMPLLERETELALIARYQDQSRSGRGALLLLGGEAGIGKTALLEAITAGMHRHGRALWALGCCPGPDETPPYVPLLQVVRRLSSQRSLESASLPAPLGAAGDARLARLRPETADALQAAAVLGEYFDWTVLKRMVDLSDDELTEVPEEARFCPAGPRSTPDPSGHCWRAAPSGSPR